jgi:hypothetical protein
MKDYTTIFISKKDHEEIVEAARKMGYSVSRGRGGQIKKFVMDAVRAFVKFKN